jgi:hypothetical protein
MTDSRAAVEHFLSAYVEDADDTVIEAIGADKALTIGHLRDLVGRPEPEIRPTDVRAAVATLTAWIRDQTGPEPHDSEDLLIHQGDEADTCPACLYQRRLDEVIAAASTVLAELRDQDAETRAVAEAWSYFADDDAPPRGMRQLYDLFADRIEALDDLGTDIADPGPRPGHGPGVPGAMHLEAFGQTITDAFGTCPYHVGSSATSKTWRDVDVRLILDDDQFHALFPGFAAANHIDAFWSLICAALSELGRARTGLPIDFQIQSMTEANAKYSGIRNPLMLIRARDDHRPTMKEADRA